MPVDPVAADAFIADVRANPISAALLERLPPLGLADCWLVAGCLFQTVWNRCCGQPPTTNIRDYDVFYFDDSDLSFEAEDRQIRRLAAAFADLDVTIELRNQARVHLWYRQRFGHDYPRLSACTDGIDRFLVACTCVGIRCTSGEPRTVYATYGLDQLYAGILRPNPLNLSASCFAEKATSYRARWPWLRIDADGATPAAACR
ncbi:MAG TPA: nucleotidyltransferase family protein [Steroidobacteraceae bacterium]|nr:nucleotidyltransferase family protein [Steroidobacteraceae bacterium]